jgi:hypothetical protein
MLGTRQLVVIAAVVSAGCARVPDPALEPAPGKSDPWRILADAPLAPRTGHIAVWTGREMIVWGGSAQGEAGGPAEFFDARDGAAYDPDVDSWRLISEAPIEGGLGYSAVWTGSEMILWGDASGGRRGDEGKGAAYNPEEDAWRIIAPSPLTARSGHLAVWTGQEMVLWGGRLTAFETERYDGEGAAYDPASDMWRKLPRGPLPAGYDAMGVWTGREVIVLATPMGEEPQGRPRQAQAAAYDPSTDSWRKLAQPPMAAYVSPPAVFLEGRMFLLSDGGPVDGGEVNGYSRPYETGGVYDVSADEWRAHGDVPPLRDEEGLGSQVWPEIAIDDEVVLNGFAYDPRDDSWRRLPDFPLRSREFPSLVWTGDELIVWGGAERPAGNVIIDPPPLLNDGAAYALLDR